ncbi:MAG TPA: DUF3459 domain-containing protein, partial [Myxococcota bacterium]|nr:DUF3459 domain-containing protein [Myxococcota bacterium]
QWEAGPGAGFTTGDAWLPIGDAGARSVAAQRRDPHSLLALYRDLIALRRAHPSLHAGSFRRLAAPDGVFAFEREHDGERAIVALSFAGEPRAFDTPDGAVAAGLSTVPGRALPDRSGRVELGASEGLVLVLS